MTALYPDPAINVNTVTLRIDVDWSSLPASVVSFCRWVYRWHTQTGDVSPSTTYLARKQGKNKRTVYRWLSAAESAGAISREVVQGVERSIIPLAVPPPPGRRNVTGKCHRSRRQNVTGPTCNDAYTQVTQQAQCVASTSSDIGGLGLPQSQSVHAGTGEQAPPATERLETQSENPPGRVPGKKGDFVSGGSGKRARPGGEASGIRGCSANLSHSVGVLDGAAKHSDLLIFSGWGKKSVSHEALPVRRGCPGGEGVSKQASLTGEARALAESLVKVGVAPRVAVDLAVSAPSEAVQQLAALPYRPARDRAAVLVASVRESWPIPAAFLDASARAKKEQAEAQNRAMRAELSKKRETTRQEAKTAFYGLPDAIRADLLARAEADLRATKRVAWDFMQKRPPEVRASWVADYAMSLMG